MLESSSSTGIVSSTSETPGVKPCSPVLSSVSSDCTEKAVDPILSVEIDEVSSMEDGEEVVSDGGAMSGVGIVVSVSACCKITVRLRRCLFWICLASRSFDIGAGSPPPFGVSWLGGVVSYSLLVTY